MNILILHGAGNSPEGNWFPWLGETLQEAGHKVWTPALPNTDSPNPDELIPFLKENSPFLFDENTIIVGHSSGAVIGLYLLETLTNTICAIYCVSAFKEHLGWDAHDYLFPREFDFGEIRKHVNRVVFLHSDDDPYCPVEHVEYLSAGTGGDLHVLTNHGHFNLEKGESERQIPSLIELMADDHI